MTCIGFLFDIWKLFSIGAYSLTKGVATMVIKINSKPIQVKEDDEEPWYSKINWMYIFISLTGYLLGFYVLDLAAWNFLSVHPFPFTKFVGVILSWFH